jgi:hypothetical protein
MKRFRDLYTEEELKKMDKEDKELRRRSKGLAERIKRLEIRTEEKRRNGTFLTPEEFRNHGF